MTFYTRIAGSHFGSSALFGSFFGVFMLVTGTPAEAANVAALAAGSWFATLPILKRIVGAAARA